MTIEQATALAVAVGLPVVLAWLGLRAKQPGEVAAAQASTLSSEAAMRAATWLQTVETLARMDRELKSLRERVEWCEGHIKTLTDRGWQWVRWAHELHALVLHARSLREMPPEGWPVLPVLPRGFDTDEGTSRNG